MFQFISKLLTPHAGRCKQQNIAAITSCLVILLAGCSPEPELPPHSVQKTRLPVRTGMRVQVDVDQDISEAQCKQLIERYRNYGAPDGQVSVHKPSNNTSGSLQPWCVENFDGQGIKFNRFIFRNDLPK